MKRIMLSVIIPVYNAESYILRCLDSIVFQPFSDLEIIIIDDGSTDCTKKICRLYQTKHQKIRLISKVNGGVSSARNLGLRLAAGQYVTFVDADDFLLPGTFNSRLFVNEYDLIQIPRTGGSFYKKYDSDIECLNKKSFNSFISSNYYFECWGKIYKKSLLDGIWFDEELKIGEDLLFFLMFSQRVCSFKLYHNTGAYHYSDVPTSAMHTLETTRYNEILLNKILKLNHNKDVFLANIILLDYFYGSLHMKVCRYKISKIFSLPTRWWVKIALLSDQMFSNNVCLIMLKILKREKI